jgi:hypothetical protein
LVAVVLRLVVFALRVVAIAESPFSFNLQTNAVCMRVLVSRPVSEGPVDFKYIETNISSCS